MLLSIRCLSQPTGDLIVNAADFGVKPNGTDAVSGVMKALRKCKEIKARKLIFPAGRYDFYPNRAFEKYLFICNNDESLKRIAFPINGFENLEIDGGGSEFVFHGFICPFVIEASTNVTLKNFSVDWSRTFHSEGKILAVYKDSIDVCFSDKFPFKIAGKTLLFTGENNEIFPFGNLLEFDANKRETAFMANDYYTGPDIPVRQISQDAVRLFIPSITGIPNNILVFGAQKRLCPAITIAKSLHIAVSGVNIYHCGGMGIIAQTSSDISLNTVKVTPSPKGGRIISITADATHFVNCSGKITMENCLFENQIDDATNIHGIYVQLVAKLSPTVIQIKLKHEQQFGFDFITPEQQLELVHSGNMVTFGQIKVKSVKRINEEYTQVELEAPLPAEAVIGDVIASLDNSPDVLIKNCIIRNNRARGLLLGSRGSILVEHNYFHTAGAAILLEGDGQFWFEQAGVRNLNIRNNIFDNCNFGIWGNAVIQVAAGIDESKRGESLYNKNITVEHNKFITFNPRLVNIYSVDGFLFKNNVLKKSNAYSNLFPLSKQFVISHSINVIIQ